MAVNRTDFSDLSQSDVFQMVFNQVSLYIFICVEAYLFQICL